MAQTTLDVVWAHFAGSALLSLVPSGLRLVLAPHCEGTRQVHDVVIYR
jgi:hypothetical protein